MASETVLIVDDDPSIASLIGDRLELEGYKILTAGTVREGLDLVRSGSPSAILLDIMLPDGDGLDLLNTLRQSGNETDVVVLTAHGTVEKAVEAIKLGAYDFVLKPSSYDELSLRLRNLLERQRLARQNAVLTQALSGDPVEPVAESPAMGSILNLSRRIADSDATALILGESGVGKGVIARYIHQHSPRRNGPFVKVDCTILSEELLASDLFGHERGAFTGAHARKVGRLEMATGGTVLLDEIGEIPLALQPKLLRVIEEGTFERVGGSQTLSTNVRFIAATNRPLANMVKEGTFRKDLYYRLNVMSLDIPPLRARPEDIPPLAGRLIEKLRAPIRSGRDVRGLSEEAWAALRAYSWPGNVRELQNVVERAWILSTGKEITLESLPPEIQPAMEEAPDAGEGRSMEQAVKEFKRRLVQEALKASGGNKADAARRLGISRTYLFRLMEQVGLSGEGG